MGGTLTLIGTAPNLIASQSLLDYGYTGLSFFAFTAIGLLALLLGIVYLWFVGRKMLDKPLEAQADKGVATGQDLLVEYYVARFIHWVQVPEDSEAVGQTLKELRWGTKFGVTVLEVIKQGSRKGLLFVKNQPAQRLSVGADYALDEDDVLAVYAGSGALDRLLETAQVRLLATDSIAGQQLQKSQLAEVILTPQSRWINQTIKEAEVRERYDLTILALKHQYQDPRPPTPNEKLLYGDTILVHGKWHDIQRLHEDRQDAVVLSAAPAPPTPAVHPGRALMAGVILLLMVVVMIVELVPAVIAVVLAAMFMLLTRCVRQVDQAYRSVNWQTIVLIACMLPMATALEKTGGIEFISEGLVQTLGAIGPVAVMAGLYGVASLFSQFISNTATAVLLYPVAILTAQQLGVSPTPLVMAVAFSASMAFATPVATPPNAMVMAAGKYTFFDFLRVGVPLQLAIAVLVILLVPVFFPF